MLVCVSGGADSMCLFEVMRHISYQRGFDIAAVHYNHMLRGEESDRDETFVMNVCEMHGIPLYSSGGDVALYAKKRGVGIEEAARDARYGFFYKTADKLGAHRIATAHTLNDNAETMIMNLARGTGTGGMGGIPPVRDNIIRPLLSTSRDEIMQFIEERNLPYVEDSSNASDDFTRNKVRHNIIPLLEDMNPRFNEAAFSASELFRADEEFIADIADLFIQDCCVGSTANATDLAVLPFSVSSRVIRKLYSIGTLSRTHVRDVLALCVNENPSASISLPGAVVYREYDRVVFDTQPKVDNAQFAPIYLTQGGRFTILGLGLNVYCKPVTYDESFAKNVVHKPFTRFLFKSIDICGKIVVRPRSEGDAIKLKGREGTKTLKKLFVEKRIPARKRSLIPVICDDEGVLGIYGIGVSDRAVPTQGDDTILISFEEA